MPDESTPRARVTPSQLHRDRVQEALDSLDEERDNLRNRLMAIPLESGTDHIVTGPDRTVRAERPLDNLTRRVQEAGLYSAQYTGNDSMPSIQSSEGASDPFTPAPTPLRRRSPGRPSVAESPASAGFAEAPEPEYAEKAIKKSDPSRYTIIRHRSIDEFSNRVSSAIHNGWICQSAPFQMQVMEGGRMEFIMAQAMFKPEE